MSKTLKKVLTIAGSDCSGGAGIQADLKTMCAHRVYGMSVITSVTVQNTQKVYAAQDIDPEIVTGQIRAVYEDIQVDAVKIGMVSNVQIIQAIKEELLRQKAKNIVLDPVMISKSGFSLLKEEAIAAMSELLQIADIVTPNIPEAELLSGIKIKGPKEMERSARVISERGAAAVLIKGGHLPGSALDIFYYQGQFYPFESPKIPGKNTHGTGCTLSAAIASNLAKGLMPVEAIKQAKAYVGQGIKDGLAIGHGVGPLGHLNEIYRQLERIEESR
ncbi:hydroxymethylpyrimidine/phosphomethylpyrimidine kinase [Lachnospiraceae bacterium PF1-21]